MAELLVDDNYQAALCRRSPELQIMLVASPRKAHPCKPHDLKRFSSHVMGLSWGGILAQEFYRLYRPRVLGLVLADTYAGWRGSLDESVWQERLATCLRDASGPPEELVRKFLPGLFTDGAPQALRDQMAVIISAFHPVGFRLMSMSSAEMDTRALLPTIVCRR